MAPPSPPLRHVAPVVALAALCLACDGGGAPGGDPHHRDAAMIHGPDHYAWYWGDLHAHTGLSADGVASDVGEGCKDCGAVATVVEDARDTYHLDFLALTEHGNGHHRVTDLAAWDQQLADLLAADDPAGGFVTVPGIEVWTWHEGGNIRDHRNLYFFGEEAELDGLAYSQVLPPDDQAPMTGDDCEALYDWVADLESLYGPVLWLPHHPALEPPASTEWDCIDLHYSPAVENYSQHGNSQTPSAEDGWDPVWSNEVPGATVDAALARQGFALELGILGGTDSHNTRPGSINEQDPQFAHYDLSYGGSLTAVQWSPEEPFDRSTLLEAIRARKTLSTSGPRIPITFWMRYDDPIEAGGTWAAMGEVADPIDPALEPSFVVTVGSEHVPYVQAVELVFPGAGRVEMWPDEVDHWWGTYDWALEPHEVQVVYAMLRIDGAAFWGDLGVANTDGGFDQEERIWTSPIWFSVTEGSGDDDDDASDDDTADDDGGDDDGCECRAAGGAPGTGPAALLLALLVATIWALRRRFLP